jgi:PEP-CTERM motif-containing protein
LTSGSLREYRLLIRLARRGTPTGHVTWGRPHAGNGGLLFYGTGLRDEGEIMRHNRLLTIPLICAAMAAIISSPAPAADLLVSASHPTLPLSASINFHADGSDLIVTFTNTAQTDVLAPPEILTAVYYDVTGPSLGLGRTSAVIGPTSSLLFPPATAFDPAPKGVGGEWEYDEGVTNAPLGQEYTIRSAGLGINGVGGRFPGDNLQGPANVNGLQYGITSAGDNPATGNSPVTGGNALIKNQVIFILSGLPFGFDPMAMISNVQFQYGTSRCDAAGSVDICFSSSVIPEPSTIILIGLGIFAHLGRRKCRLPV